MNRAQRRAHGIVEKVAPSLVVTRAQMDDVFQGIGYGALVTIRGRAWKDGTLHKCEEGQETPFCLKAVQ